MKRLLLILGATFLGLASLAARGTTAPLPDSLLGASPAPRPAALGGSYVAVSDDASALFYNPAGLAFLDRADLSVMHFQYSSNTVYEATSYAMPYPDRCGWGFRAGYVDYGSQPLPDGSGAIGNLQDVALGAGFGFQAIKNVAAGFQASWTSRSEGPVVRHGLWWDLGVLARASKRFQAGIALKNLGVGEGGETLPFTFQWGGAYRGWSMAEGQEGLLLCAGGSYAPHGRRTLDTGIEFNHQDRFFFRLGYSPDLKSSESSATEGLNLGGAVRVKQFQLDYTLTLGEKTGEYHRVALTYLFPCLAPRLKPAPRVPAPPGALSRAATPSPTPVSSQAVSTPSTPAPQPGSVALPTDGKSRVVLPFKVEDTVLMSAEECLAQGQALEKQNKPREALRYYLAASEKKPEIEKTWLLLGNLQVRLGMDAYREALRLNPNNEALRLWFDKTYNR